MAQENKMFPESAILNGRQQAQEAQKTKLETRSPFFGFQPALLKPLNSTIANEQQKHTGKAHTKQQSSWKECADKAQIHKKLVTLLSD
jgi:hypothetical protein